MANGRYDGYDDPAEPERRRRQATRAKRRKKRQMQRIILFVGLAVAAALIVFCIVMILRAVFTQKEPASSDVGPGSSQASGASGTDPAASGSGDASVPIPGQDWPVAVDPNVWNLVLVNGQRPLAAGHSIPEDQLGTISHSGVAYYFDSRIVNDLSEMMRQCNAAGGSLRVVSGYRGEKNQNDRYNHLLATGMSDADARRREPPAGYSEHQTGLAVDFAVGNDTAVNDSFAGTAEFAWLAEHAHEYGFILRYTAEKEAITGMVYQPYHFRYVGVEDATTIKNSGICLEEYLATLPAVDGGA